MKYGKKSAHRKQNVRLGWKTLIEYSIGLSKHLHANKTTMGNAGKYKLQLYRDEQIVLGNGTVRVYFFLLVSWCFVIVGV